MPAGRQRTAFTVCSKALQIITTREEPTSSCKPFAVNSSGSR